MATVEQTPSSLAELRQVSSPTVPTKLSTAETPSSRPPGHLRRALLERGYIHIPNLLPRHLLLAAQATSKYLVSRTRTGTFRPYVRTVPKQYPPWPSLDLKSPSDDLNIWGIQHLLHPDLTSLRDVYAEIYFSEEVISVVRELLGRPDGTDEGDATTKQGVTDNDLVMELFNLLCSPTKNQDFELAWHRDDVRPDVTPEVEEQQLQEKAPGGRQLHAQYNIALFEDESLIVIPGSHRRTRTQAERDASQYEVLEDELLVKLEPGDAVFYDSNLLHRGVYEGIDENNELGRMTLHGSVGLKGYGNERARQVLQHGIGDWIEKDNAAFVNVQDDDKKKRAELMRNALIDMGKGRGDVGFSLEG